MYGIPEKLKYLFNNKDKVSHYSCMIYRGICSCWADYIGVTVRNAQLRWNEHENGTDKNSECVKHLNENDTNGFKWFILSLTPELYLKGRFLKPISLMLGSHRGDDIHRLGRRNLVASDSSPKLRFQSIPTTCTHSVLNSSSSTKRFY